MVDVRVVVFVRPMVVELSRYVVEKGRRKMDKAEPQKSQDMTGG
jgi:N-acyl-L-homoserine lactone synthetase